MKNTSVSYLSYSMDEEKNEKGEYAKLKLRVRRQSFVTVLSMDSRVFCRKRQVLSVDPS